MGLSLEEVLTPEASTNCKESQEVGFIPTLASLFDPLCKT